MNVVATGTLESGVYKVDCQQNAAYLVVQINIKNLWHRHLGHVNHFAMNFLKNGMAHGVNCAEDKYEHCEPCVKGKQHKELLSVKAERPSEVL